MLSVTMATLHFRSPVYMQRGYGLLFHKSPYYIQPGYGQDGAGIGSFFRSIFRFIAPAAKKTFKAVGSILSNPAVKDVLDVAKQEGIKVGINALANAVQGNSVVEPIQSDIADSRERLATTIRSKAGSGKKRSAGTLGKTKGAKKKKTSEPEPDLFSA